MGRLMYASETTADLRRRLNIQMVIFYEIQELPRRQEAAVGIKKPIPPSQTPYLIELGKYLLLTHSYLHPCLRT